jgi:hypothetical protein
MTASFYLRKNPCTIGYGPALEAMRRGEPLIREYSNDGCRYFVSVGQVGAKVVEKLRRRHGLVAGDDGLFPDTSQTFRFRSVTENRFARKCG